jgi:hypothetical protein
MADARAPTLLLADEIAPGGMKTVELDGHEIVICNCSGETK